MSNFSATMTDYQSLNVRLNFESDDELKAGATNIISMIRPEWERDQHQFKFFSEGITNKLIGVYVGEDKANMILIRVYGNKTELFVDRQAEIRNMKLMSDKGLGGKLFATFENGLAYEFVAGDVLTVESCRQPEIYPAVAAAVARMHRTASEGGDRASPCLWKKLQQFNSLSPDEFADADMNRRYRADVFSKEEREAEIEEMKTILSGLNNPIVFCHNDLLLANIVVKPNKEISFIDFEYGDFNYQAFDIADHFCEFAGVDATNLDYAKFYPDKDFQLKWLRTYLEEFKLGDVSDEEVETLYKVVNKFALTVRLFWGTWSLVQASISKLDFDFLGYAILIFNEYKKRKAEFLNL